MVELCYISPKLTEKAKTQNHFLRYCLKQLMEVLPIPFPQAFVKQEGNICSQI